MKNVYLIGDSIRYGAGDASPSMGYGKLAAGLLADDFVVYQPEENCRFCTYTFRHLPDWLKPAMRGNIDIVHWNNGLWDMALTGPDFEPLVPIEFYKQTLPRIFRRIRYFCPQAKIIFALTTPVCEEGYRKAVSLKRTNALIEEYNRAAIEVLSPLGVQFNDLYSLMKGSGADAYADGKVHFTAEGCMKMAQQVAACIRKAAAEE